MPCATVTPPVNVPTPPPCKGFIFGVGVDDRFMQLMRKFDEQYARIYKIIARIEDAEKKREIESELDCILDVYNISKADRDERE